MISCPWINITNMKRLPSKILNLKNETWMLVPLFSRYMISSASRLKYSRIIRDGKDVDEDVIINFTSDTIILDSDVGEKVEFKVSKLAYVCFIEVNENLGTDFSIKHKDNDSSNRSVSNMNAVLGKNNFTTIYDLVYLVKKDRWIAEILLQDIQDSCITIRARLLWKNSQYIFVNEMTKDIVYTEEVMAAKQTCINNSVATGVFQVGNIYDVSIFQPRDRLTFGKHKGSTVSEVRKLDAKHLKWINLSMPHAYCNIKL